ncbi:hypothetical protein MMC25_000253 [Agyrium rufum]|nr:hypothetical protein [Agyrium rufum]
MVLTTARRNQNDDYHSKPSYISIPSPEISEPFPTAQLFLLAICRLAEPIALTSIFPYAWPMVKSFSIGDANSASFYAGILISSFALFEALTSMYWGSLSDRVGRKPVLLLGCAGTMISMMTMGFATNFWMALAGRALGGCLNGNIPVIQTMVGELVKKPEHEPRAYAVMPFVWSIGTIIGPAIGGTFANPSKTFPNTFSSEGLFGRFPYLLPNLICSALLLLSIFAGYYFLQETHPDFQPGAPAPDAPEHEEVQTAASGVPLIGSVANAGADLRAESYGTFNQVEIDTEQVPITPWEERQKIEFWSSPSAPSSRPASITEKKLQKTKLFTRRIMMLVIALGIFTYHSMSYDHLLPIFLQDATDGSSSDNEAAMSPSSFDMASNAMGAPSTSLFHIPGGLGLSTSTVGVIMSINGIIALFIQALIFPLFAEWLGVWRVFLLVTILHPIAYFIVPLVAFLPSNLLFPGIYACLTIRNFFAILGYPVLLILLKEACPRPSALGLVNGLAASAAAASRTLSPPIAGLIYAWGKQIRFTGWAWWASGVVALVGAVQLVCIEREKYKVTTVSVAAEVQSLIDVVRSGEEEA